MTRTNALRLSMLNLNMKKYIASASVVGGELEIGIQKTTLNAYDAILLDYVQYAIEIESTDYTPQDKALDFIIN